MSTTTALYRNYQNTALFEVQHTEDGSMLLVNMNGTMPCRPVSQAMLDSLVATESLQLVPQDEMADPFPVGSYWFDPKGLTILIVKSEFLTRTFTIYGFDKVHRVPQTNLKNLKPVNRQGLEELKRYLPVGGHIVLRQKSNSVIHLISDVTPLTTRISVVGGLRHGATVYASSEGWRINTSYLVSQIMLEQSYILPLKAGYEFRILTENAGKLVEELDIRWQSEKTRLANIHGVWRKERILVIDEIVSQPMRSDEYLHLAGVRFHWKDDFRIPHSISLETWFSLERNVIVKKL